jgi:hypothetical protein
LAAVCWWWLPKIGVGLPPWVPIVGFVLILTSTLLTLSRDHTEAGADGAEDEGEGPLRIDLERGGDDLP